MGHLILKTLVGAGAGLLAWMLTEPGYGKSDSSELWMVLMAGGLIGLAIGGLNGLESTRRKALIGAGLGLIFGVIGISLGYSVGSGIVTAMFQVPPNLVPGPQKIIARAMALAPVGLFLGAAVGASTLHVKRFWQGLMGGAIAGLATGVLFDIIGGMVGTPALVASGQTTGEVGQIPRAITWTLLGGTIGLFIGIVERATRQAWVRLSLGRNEGKEWAIYGANTMIGRSEMAQIPLYSDQAVAPAHAVIQYHQGNYFLTDLGSGAPTYLNGQPIQQAPLGHGAEIRVGNSILHFMLKSAKVAYVPTPMPMQPTTAMPAQGGMQPTVAMAAPTAGVWLTAIDGPLLGQRFPIMGSVEVGRESPAIPLAFDSGVSRRHAQLTAGLGSIQVTDLGSTNGVLVDGQRVTSGTARVGSMIKIGSTTFRVEA